LVFAEAVSADEEGGNEHQTWRVDVGRESADWTRRA
jgi:hypothetical protein